MRRDKEKKRERPERKSESSHDGGESKENQEAQVEPMGELTKDEESKAGQDAKSANLRKRGGMGEQVIDEMKLCLSLFLSLLNGLDKANDSGYNPDWFWFTYISSPSCEVIHLQNVVFFSYRCFLSSKFGDAYFSLDCDDLYFLACL